MLALVGCSVTSPIWTTVDDHRITWVPGGEARLVEKCTRGVIVPFPSSSGNTVHCEYALRAPDGSITPRDAILRSVAASLGQVAPLGAAIDELTPRRGPAARSTAQWYALYMVAASPTVVVGVPVTDRGDARCWAEARCKPLRGQGAWQITLRIAAAPTTAGSFVYAPADPGRTLSFPAPNTTVELPIEGGPLLVSNAGGAWRVVRKP